MVNAVHLIFKTHLDVGFTDLAGAVVERYFRQYIPQAVALARSLRLAGAADRFVWTTGSWLIYEYLEQASAGERAALEDAVAHGEIAWHALPFTTHTGLLDPALFRFGLSLSQALDRRFGRQTVAAKMTDVPGHPRAIVPLMAEAGVRFLHIGVNPACTPPDVPPVFRWQHPSGAELMVMYHKGSYGDGMKVRGLDSAIAFAHTGDNRGPQNAEQIADAYAHARTAFPGARVFASTLDAFAVQLEKVRGMLPVVTGEIGDTWIHGAATDPAKLARYRALLRLREGWLRDGRVGEDDPHYRAFCRKLLLVPEHTWGLDVKTWLADWESYTPDQVEELRSRPNFQRMEQSWAEQRAYVSDSIAALAPLPLAAEAEATLEALKPAYPDPSGFLPVADPLALLQTTHFAVRFDGHGALVDLTERRTGKVWADPTHPCALARYQSFDQGDYDRYYRQYAINTHLHASWAVPDLTKPGIAEAGAVRGDWPATLTGLQQRRTPDGWLFLVQMNMAPGAVTLGAPRALIAEMGFPDAEPTINITLQWFDKPASRLPEALWYSFSLRVGDPAAWRLDVMGDELSPQEVIAGGNRYLHAVGRGVTYGGVDGQLAIDSPDAALVAPGERSLLNFDGREPDLGGGMHFLLYDNIWGTNFPMWYDENGRFRFSLRFG